MNLLNLMNNDLFKAFCFLVFLGFLILVAYEKGYSNCEFKMQSEMREVELKNNKLIIEKERALRIEQDKIVNDYLETIETMRAKHEQDIIEINNLRDTITIPQCVSDNNQGTNKSGNGLSKKTGNKPDLKCYTDAELLSKIKRSLDIAGEADRLAERYNSLLEWCKK